MQGYLVIADLTGYTYFLAHSELEHAQDILNTVMNTLTASLGQGLVISKLEGDAILTYAPERHLQSGHSLLDLVESTYVRFRKERDNMQASTTCTCKACKNIPTLDLKFFIHHGEFLLVKIAGGLELSGPDVILIHRLLKNDSSKQAGLDAYILFTHQALDAMQLREFGAGLTHAEELYEHLGKVSVCLHDLRPVWDRDRTRINHRILPDEHAGVVSEITLPVSQATAWDIITSPESRLKFMQATSMEVSEKSNGRIQAGATYHCSHGGNETLQYILDWNPVNYLTTRDTVMRLLGAPVFMTTTFSLHPAPDGQTTTQIVMSKPTSPNPASQWLAGLLWVMIFKKSILTSFEEQGFPAMREIARERLTQD